MLLLKILTQDPLYHHLTWTKPPLRVLVIKKLCNNLFESFIEILKYLIYHHRLIVYVEESQYDHELMQADDAMRAAMTTTTVTTPKSAKPSLRKFSKEINEQSTQNDCNEIDLIICLGGDGTLLHASTLFQKKCPPVLSIHMGSLGFLCPFDFDNFKNYVNGVLKGGVPLLLRSRLKCRLEQRSVQPPSTSSSLNMAATTTGAMDESMSHSGMLQAPNANSSGISNDHSVNHAPTTLIGGEHLELLSLNEVVVSRGPSPFLSNLDLYVNDYLITTVQGDGLIISTPTGSTAYAMAAGASMNHPSIPAIIIAPICPHSLSFRPITVPAAVELKISLSPESRTNAWYSIDGRSNNELTSDTQLCITTSEYPLPSICRSDQINDWFEGLAMCLHWNQRQKQLPLNECYMQQQQQQVHQGGAPSVGLNGRSMTASLSQSQLHSSFSTSKSSASSASSSDLHTIKQAAKECNTTTTTTTTSTTRFHLDE